MEGALRSASSHHLPSCFCHTGQQVCCLPDLNSEPGSRPAARPLLPEACQGLARSKACDMNMQSLRLLHAAWAWSSAPKFDILYWCKDLIKKYDQIS